MDFLEASEFVSNSINQLKATERSLRSEITRLENRRNTLRKNLVQEKTALLVFQKDRFKVEKEHTDFIEAQKSELEVDRNSFTALRESEKLLYAQQKKDIESKEQELIDHSKQIFSLKDELALAQKDILEREKKLESEKDALKEEKAVIITQLESLTEEKHKLQREKDAFSIKKIQEDKISSLFEEREQEIIGKEKEAQKLLTELQKRSENIKILSDTIKAKETSQSAKYAILYQKENLIKNKEVLLQELNQRLVIKEKELIEREQWLAAKGIPKFDA